MSKPIIKAEDISKCYLIKHEMQQGCIRYERFSETLINFFQPKNKSVTKEEFWALKDIDFEVHQGDRIGIIGRNGAGKSTLLKVLSKITAPTTGKISIDGRIASLLEVGTGFHPDLSGRENIYLNGSILGMKRAEIRKKFDEIVDFSGVENFLDTPVKRYSSGMYVRLAFAVAAHLEPEILVVDEVLAVGDAEFQKKCLGKMNEINKEQGRTILFVSHNMSAIRQLCNHGMFIENGMMKYFGDINNAINLYNDSSFAADLTDLSNIKRKPGCANKTKWKKIEFCDNDGNPTVPTTGQDLTVRLYVDTEEPVLKNCTIIFYVENLLNNTMLYFTSEASCPQAINLTGKSYLACRIPRLPLLGGRYNLGLILEVNCELEDWISEIGFEVSEAPYWNTSKNAPCFYDYANGWDSVPLVDHEWIVKQ